MPNTGIARKESPFKRGITLGEVIGFSITIVLCIGGFWKNIDTRITILEQQSRTQNEKFTDIKDALQRIENKQDVLTEKQSETLIKLASKADKP